MKINKILGKRGRITIPFDIRKEMGFEYNDVVSFEIKGNAILVKREKICDNCKEIPAPAYCNQDGMFVCKAHGTL